MCHYTVCHLTNSLERPEVAGDRHRPSAQKKTAIWSWQSLTWVRPALFVESRCMRGIRAGSSCLDCKILGDSGTKEPSLFAKRSTGTVLLCHYRVCHLTNSLERPEVAGDWHRPLAQKKTAIWLWQSLTWARPALFVESRCMCGIRVGSSCLDCKILGDSGTKEPSLFAKLLLS